MARLALSGVGEELLDDPAADPAAVRESLRNIARSNRWFGGAQALRWALGRALAGVPRGTTLTLLDIGTGSGDLPRAAAAWGARRGLTIVPIGLERSRVAAALARERGVPTVVACASALPVRPGAADVVLVSQVAHHLAPDSAVALFAACERLARRAVIVADLRRSALARLAFRGGAALLRFDHVTRHDGVLSIRRGYTPAELRELTRRAGVRARVARRPGFRLVAIWRTARTGS